jgi:Flp pilus assembly protein TadD
MTTKQSEGYKEQGNNAFRAGDFEKAVEMYTNAIECMPKNPSYYTNRVRCSQGSRRVQRNGEGEEMYRPPCSAEIVK